MKMGKIGRGHNTWKLMKCKSCGKEFEAASLSLCSYFRMCKKCIQEIWGTRDFIHELEICKEFQEGDIIFYEKLFKLRK
jgi:hypothetical protein